MSKVRRHELREAAVQYATLATAQGAESVEVESHYIERIPEIGGGQPVIAGTRIPVWVIVDHFKAGRSLGYIMENYDLTAEQVYSALSYYYRHTDEIEQAIRLNSSEEYWREWLERNCS